MVHPSMIPSSPYLDMVVSHLREQLVKLQKVVETVERNHSYQEDYVYESIKSVESELRRLRKLINL
ncbi:MAG TPA: hypothetical protein VI749_07960 [Candidatus Omnitrophota bacterium]|nr:hypothetical protein [Candidatus Omnitrophota bacterium]